MFTSIRNFAGKRYKAPTTVLLVVGAVLDTIAPLGLVDALFARRTKPFSVVTLGI